MPYYWKALPQSSKLQISIRHLGHYELDSHANVQAKPLHQDERHSSTEMQSPESHITTPRAEEKSKHIDEALKEDAERRRGQVKVLPLGAFSMSDVVKQLRTTDTDDAGLTENELISYRHNIHQSVFAYIPALLGSIDASEAPLHEDIKSSCNCLRSHLSVPPNDLSLDGEAVKAIESLWQEPSVMEAVESKVESDLKESCA